MFNIIMNRSKCGIQKFTCVAGRCRPRWRSTEVQLHGE